MQDREKVRKFIDGLGGVSIVARRRDVTPQCVRAWIARGYVPSDQALWFHSKIGIPMDEIPTQEVE
jgi:hypothetical protein